ncbi:FkbM family methyltransferase [Kluyvera georgiana]|uniref:FkbM family methyltransferase n=1 Tax=Kluyvera georgiana TaxID=73098 RepID=UPI00321FFD24
MKRNIILDVGANYGGFSIEIAKRNPEIPVYAIEAEPGLASFLENDTNDISNHFVINCAVSLKEGEFDFYISEFGDHGTSSLYPFSKQHISTDPYWKHRDDLRHNKKTKVKALRLESILDGLNFIEIEFIKIDVQGMDLAVLESSGKYLKKIKAGMLEVPAVIEKSLYEETREDLLKALTFLSNHGFRVYAIKPNDPASNEFNVFFTREDIQAEEVESNLNLKHFHFYDGKNFWHVPSDKLEDPAQHILNLQAVLDQETDKKNMLEAEIRAIKSELANKINMLESLDNNKFVRILKFLNLIK